MTPEALSAAMEAAAILENDGDEHGVGKYIRDMLATWGRHQQQQNREAHLQQQLDIAQAQLEELRNVVTRRAGEQPRVDNYRCDPWRGGVL